jgi:hypothetical protein
LPTSFSGDQDCKWYVEDEYVDYFIYASLLSVLTSSRANNVDATPQASVAPELINRSVDVPILEDGRVCFVLVINFSK